MTAGRIVQSDMDIKKILEQTRSIAVVGLSPKPDRASYRVADYLQQHRYTVIPVRPAQKEILGAKAYPSLTDIKEPIDIVDVFRRSDQMMPHVEEAIQIKARVFWMQLGIENAEAASLLTQAGIDVVMDRCIKIEHDRLLS